MLLVRRLHCINNSMSKRLWNADNIENLQYQINEAYFQYLEEPPEITSTTTAALTPEGDTIYWTQYTIKCVQDTGSFMQLASFTDLLASWSEGYQFMVSSEVSTDIFETGTMAKGKISA